MSPDAAPTTVMSKSSIEPLPSSVSLARAALVDQLCPARSVELARAAHAALVSTWRPRVRSMLSPPSSR